MSAPLTPDAVQAIRNFQINEGGRSLGNFGTVDFIDQMLRDIDALNATMLNCELEGTGIPDTRLTACLETVETLLALLALSEKCRRDVK